MTNNVDVNIDLEDETIEGLLEEYIRITMCSASQEVFEREKENSSIRESAGCALLNEAIIVAIKLGMKADDILKENTNMDTSDND